MNVDKDGEIGTQVVNSSDDGAYHEAPQLKSAENISARASTAENMVDVDNGDESETAEGKVDYGDKAAQIEPMALGASSPMKAIELSDEDNGSHAPSSQGPSLHQVDTDRDLENVTEEAQAKSETSESSENDQDNSQPKNVDIAMTGINPVGIRDEDLNRHDQFIFHTFVKVRPEKKHINFFSEEKKDRIVEVEMEDFIHYYDLAVRFANITFGRVKSARTRAILRPVGYGALV